MLLKEKQNTYHTYPHDRSHSAPTQYSCSWSSSLNNYVLINKHHCFLISFHFFHFASFLLKGLCPGESPWRKQDSHMKPKTDSHMKPKTRVHTLEILLPTPPMMFQGSDLNQYYLPLFTKGNRCTYISMH